MYVSTERLKGTDKFDYHCKSKNLNYKKCDKHTIAGIH